MLIKKPQDTRSSEITPKDLYLNRRKFLAGVGLAGAVAATGVGLRELVVPAQHAFADEKIPGIQKSPLSINEKITPQKDVTHYNNYYEFRSEERRVGKECRSR